MRSCGTFSPVCPDASLYLLPSLSHLRVDVGDDARLDCYLSTDGQSVVPPGAFSWTDGAGRALSGTDDERISISVSTYGTVSTLRISSVSRDDEGSFTCSYTGLSNVSIMLDVVGEFTYALVLLEYLYRMLACSIITLCLPLLQKVYYLKNNYI